VSNIAFCVCKHVTVYGAFLLGRVGPKALLERFELRSHGLAPPSQTEAGKTGAMPVDIGARMRAMWR
jgi:hypothetical protein